VQGIRGVLKQADAKDKAAVNTVLLLGIALAAIGVGMGLMFIEYNLPLGAFRKQIKALSSGSISQLTVDRMRGPFRQLALDLNLALDRAPRSSIGDDGAVAVGFDQIFGDAAPASSPPMAAFGVPGSVPPASAAAPVQPAAAQIAAPQYGQAAGAFDFGASAAQASAAARGAIPPRRARGAQQPLAQETFPGGGQAAVALAPAPPEVATLHGTGEPAPNGGTELEPEWTQVYHDFVKLKQDCGEAVEGFTFERFTQTLFKTRDKLMREHGVQRVHFSAYVKQGHAALKAKPVRE
jgi:hypothetical protein